jgi:ElaB/YqjD/DUF883 family membrane-anchored ribosome-binding protein
MTSGILDKAQPTVDDILREVSRLKSVDARHTVKQKPLQAVAVVFAAGVLTGRLLGWISTRRR